jgi:DNA-binding ferritin-like protein
MARVLVYPKSNNTDIVSKSNSGQASLIAFVGFELRTITHKAHLQATGIGSYAKHKALEDFYEKIVDILDEFVEVYQGRYGVLVDYSTSAYWDFDSSNIVKTIKEFARLLDIERPNFTPEIQNILDSLQALNLRTIYKLENLQ